jgi:hypothetical protein
MTYCRILDFSGKPFIIHDHGTRWENSILLIIRALLILTLADRGNVPVLVRESVDHAQSFYNQQ